MKKYIMTNIETINNFYRLNKIIQVTYSIPLSVIINGTLVGAACGLNITSMYLEQGTLDIISLVVTKLAQDRPNDGINFFPGLPDIDDVTYV